MTGPAQPADAELRERIMAALAGINDPELGRSVVELGMVRELAIIGSAVTVTLALTVAGCPLKDYFHREVPARVRDQVPEIDTVHLELTTMSESERGAVIGSVRAGASPVGLAGSRTRVIAVGSGKGGVGKSTVAVNLAVALAQQGHRVGLLDADIWGWSVPQLLGTRRQPTIVGDLIMPVEGHGVAALSIGNIVPEGKPVVWRGPMLHKALEQMLRDVHWDDRDFLVIDMPPGTGDVSISLAQMLPGARFLLVTTAAELSQDVALRAGSMMTHTGLTLAGIVVNMAGFTCECGREHSLFGDERVERLCQALDTNVLARVPFDTTLASQGLVSSGESPMPAALREPPTPTGDAFRELAATLARTPSIVRVPLPLLV